MAIANSWQALQSAQDAVARATLLQGDAGKLPFPGERFDVVLCAKSIQRLRRPGALEEMQRVLKHGGIIAIW